MPMRVLGVSKVCITPQRPVRLCGFGFRKTSYETVRDDIYVRVFDLIEDGERIVFLYGDLLWWNSFFVERMKSEIEIQLSIPGDRVLFVASHNHSGPGTGSSFIPLLETEDEEYIVFLQGRIMTALHLAERDREEVVIARSEGECRLNVYRRFKTDSEIRMMPNYEVMPDRTLTVFSFYRGDGTLKGRIVHYPCHANLSKDNELHPDFPGYVLREMDRKQPGSISIYLQGCTADLRPNCVLGNQFQSAGIDEVKGFARLLCIAIESAVRKEILIENGLDIRHLKVRLPVIQNFSCQEVKARLEGGTEEIRQWAVRVLEKNLRDYEMLELSAVRLGRELMYFFNAEVSMYYAIAARKRYAGTICTGYTNGMIGYLSTAEQIKEGGYEPCDSAIWFAVAGTYDETIEKLIYEGMEEAGKWNREN